MKDQSIVLNIRFLVPLLVCALVAPAVAADTRGLGSEEHFVNVLRRSTSVADPSAFAYVVVGDQAAAFVLSPEATERLVAGSPHSVGQVSPTFLGEILVPDQAGVVDGGCVPIPIWLRWLRGRYELVALNHDGEVLATTYPSVSEIDALFGSANGHLRGTKPKASDIVRAVGEILITVANYLASIGFSIDGLPQGTWTDWLNRDRPSGSGDFETLADFVARGEACAAPLDIECRTVGGTDWSETGQTYTCEQYAGGVCRNSQQPSGRCLNYQVRFLCAD